MDLGFKTLALTALLSSSLSLSTAAFAQAQPQQAPADQQAVPDAPAPQAPSSLKGIGPLTPGIGTPASTATSSTSTDVPQQAPATQPPPSQTKDVQTTPPENMTPEDIGSRFVSNTTYVEVPVTVKDTKGKPIAGLTWRDFKVYENDTWEPLKIFTVDPAPLSIAFVIDQSLTSDVMSKVNNSLSAFQGALSPYDEVAIFSYNNGPREWTGFTGAQGNRVPAVLALAKSIGRDEQVPINSGPFAGCAIVKNGGCVDSNPTVQQGGAVGNPDFITLHKEIHTLNDAILAAAKELSTRPQGRRRIIYVISDGKEYGSKATYKDVLRYLQTNKIAVYGTAVGDSARWGEGYVSRLHLPFTMYDNRLAGYVLATGGILDSEGSLNGIEKSYAQLAQEARNQYTLVYSSHQPLIDDRYRKIEVRVDRPGVEVIAKKGYYPSGKDQQH
ncbi:VWA domain-containing protein [Telmatobacter sp. DSM 110680]|uniref:VWA domain-containing protein n=1 Tax=Telmatobacter sp. DSM 110680 TaxID=3036704 RepID=A0AAU7DLF8_9BACT